MKIKPITTETLRSHSPRLRTRKGTRPQWAQGLGGVALLAGWGEGGPRTGKSTGAFPAVTAQIPPAFGSGGAAVTYSGRERAFLGLSLFIYKVERPFLPCQLLHCRKRPWSS